MFPKHIYMSNIISQCKVHYVYLFEPEYFTVFLLCPLFFSRYRGAVKVVKLVWLTPLINTRHVSLPIGHVLTSKMADRMLHLCICPAHYYCKIYMSDS